MLHIEKNTTLTLAAAGTLLATQIDINLRNGLTAPDAVLDAGISRQRPLSMAAFTTVLGVTPLIFDIFWKAWR